MTVAAPLRVAGQYEVEIDWVVVGKRWCHLDEQRVLEKMASISSVGLLSPILVRPDGTLIAGWHRLEACKRLGWERIPADVREYSDADAEIAEIDENLTGSHLSWLQQCEQFTRRRDLLAETGRLTKVGDNQYTEVRHSDAGPLTTSADLAAAVGLKERAARIRYQVASIPETVREAVRLSPVAESLKDLVALAQLQGEEQEKVAGLIRDGQAKSVWRAQKLLNPDLEGEGEDDDDPDPGLDDADIAERMNVVDIIVEISFRVPNPKTRMRGDTVLRRESVDAVHRIPVRLGVDYRERGMLGLREAINKAAADAFGDERLRTDWERIP